MENQHRLIKGYRELSKNDIELMNKIKQKGAELLELCNQARAQLNEQADFAINARDEDTIDLFYNTNLESPLYWVDEGEATLRKAVMYIVRAVAQPRGI